MPVVIREQGFRVAIYVDDHEPAHVHVLGDGEVKIMLGLGGAEPQIMFSRHMSFRDVNRAFAIVSRNNARLLLEWKNLHG